MVGYVAVRQVPLIFTFDKAKVELIVEMLSEGIEYSYNHMSMFSFEDFDEDQWENEE